MMENEEMCDFSNKKKDINWDAGKWLGYGHVNGCGCWRGWLILVNEEIKR